LPIGKFFKKLLGGSNDGPARHFDETDDELQYLWRRRDHLTPKERMNLSLEFAVRAVPIAAPRPGAAALALAEALRPETLPDEGATLEGAPITVYPGARVAITLPDGTTLGFALPTWWPLAPDAPSAWGSLAAEVAWSDVGEGWSLEVGGARAEAVRASEDMPWSVRVDTGRERVLVGPSIPLELLPHPDGRPTHLVGSLALPDEEQLERMTEAWDSDVSDELIAAWVVADAAGVIPLWSQSMLDALGFTTYFCATRLPCNPDLQTLVAPAVAGDAAGLAESAAQAEGVHVLAGVGWLSLTGQRDAAWALLEAAEAAAETPTPELLFARGELTRQDGDLKAARKAFTDAGEAGYGRAWTNLAAMTAADGERAAALRLTDKAAKMLEETVTDNQTGTEHLRLSHPSTLHLLTVLRWAEGDRVGAFEAVHLAHRELTPWMAELLEALVDEGKPDSHELPLTSVRVGHQESLLTAGYLTYNNGSQEALALASRLLTAVLDQEPHFFEGRVVLSDVLFAQGDRSEGQKVLDEALERAPLSAKLYAVVAERATAAGDHSKAAAAWARAFELAPEEAWLRLNQCLASIAGGDLSAADEVIEAMAYDQVDIRTISALKYHRSAAK